MRCFMDGLLDRLVPLTIVHMLAESAKLFDIVDHLADKLGLARKAVVRKAETHAAIVDRLEKGFAATKHWHTEQQRQEHGIGLALVAPERDSSMIARIGEVLN
ncbi:MAG: hypothetical protein SGPRY_004221 [Prymnesium sp.]